MKTHQGLYTHRLFVLVPLWTVVEIVDEEVRARGITLLMNENHHRLQLLGRRASIESRAFFRESFFQHSAQEKKQQSRETAARVVERRRRGVGAILHIYRQSKGLSKPPFYRRCKGLFSCSLKAVRKGPTVFQPQKIGKYAPLLTVLQTTYLMPLSLLIKAQS